MIAGAFVVALAVGVWALWPRDDTGATSTTVPLAATTTTERDGVPTTSSTSTPDPSVATRTTASHVVTTVEEAEGILRELWFGWFEGIYHQDENRIREVVASQSELDAAREQFGIMSFDQPPTPEGIDFGGTKILRADSGCLVVKTEISLAGFRSGSSEIVNVMRWTDESWASVSLWEFENDLWEADCESQLESLH